MFHDIQGGRGKVESRGVCISYVFRGQDSQTSCDELCRFSSVYESCKIVDRGIDVRAPNAFDHCRGKFVVAFTLRTPCLHCMRAYFFEGREGDGLFYRFCTFKQVQHGSYISAGRKNKILFGFIFCLDIFCFYHSVEIVCQLFLGDRFKLKKMGT